jgi:hypothetical protein
MTSELLSGAFDASSLLSLMLGFCIGYAFGRLHNRTEKAVHDAEVAIEEVINLKHQIEDEGLDVDSR